MSFLKGIWQRTAFSLRFLFFNSIICPSFPWHFVPISSRNIIKLWTDARNTKWHLFLSFYFFKPSLNVFRYNNVYSDIKKPEINTKCLQGMCVEIGLRSVTSRSYVIMAAGYKQSFFVIILWSNTAKQRSVNFISERITLWLFMTSLPHFPVQFETNKKLTN